MLDINFFQSLAEYANENWKGSFTPEEVREYAEIYFSDFKISLENGKETETISSLIKNLKEDSDNGISEAEEFLGKLHYEKYCRNFNEIHRREEKEILISVDGTELSKIYDCFGHTDENEDIVYDLEIVTKGGKYYHLYNVADSRLVFKRRW